MLHDTWHTCIYNTLVLLFIFFFLHLFHLPGQAGFPPFPPSVTVPTIPTWLDDQTPRISEAMLSDCYSKTCFWSHTLISFTENPQNLQTMLTMLFIGSAVLRVQYMFMPNISDQVCVLVRVHSVSLCLCSCPCLCWCPCPCVYPCKCSCS